MHLISTGALDDEGYHNHFEVGKWKLTKGYLVVARGVKQASLYTMQGRSYRETNMVKTDTVDLWHMRLGHMSEKGMQILARKEVLLASGVLTKKNPHCIAGKKYKASFKCGPSRKSKIFELVHTDVCSLGKKTLEGA